MSSLFKKKIIKNLKYPPSQPNVGTPTTPISFPSVVFSIADGGDDSPRGSASFDHILVGHGEKVTLLHGEFLVVHRGGDLLHELHYLSVLLCLLRHLHHVHVLFASSGRGCHTIVDSIR